ncbi:MAG TPA: GGDEF domain-containing protein, partial [Candidatus Sulfomarinibacteraceae bacterium]|nr:GGDEF domain-containing protein [Candidatus Sulfomarinibacteraceae bacterium]
GLKRAEDSFGRLSGDEFVVFMPHADLAGAAVLAERFQDAIHRHEVAHGNQVLRITASFGVAELRETDASPTDLLARADRAMYRAKAAGGDTVRSVDCDDDGGNRAAAPTSGRARG